MKRGRKPEPLLDRLNKNSIILTESGCQIWERRLSNKGYGVIKVSGKPIGAHRIMYKETFGDIPAGMYVCHRCDVRCCINPSHLFLGTHKENMADMIRKGRARPPYKAGVKKPKPKLSREDVLIIRESNETQRTLMNKYGVSDTTISNIKTRKTWRHLK